MASTRAAPLALLSVAVLGGTLYSVIYHTYLDTSDPLLSNLPHPLHHTSLFAQKSNIFNTIFIKRAWGWTSAAFFAVWLTSPGPLTTRLQPLYKWLATTLVWGTFAAWFFGPALMERLVVASGGECVLQLPLDPNAPAGQHPTLLAVPPQYCYTRSTISPRTHPSLFSTSLASSSLDVAWTGRPRLYRGHDVSGHIFLLTLSVLFLHDLLAPTWRLIASSSSSAFVSSLHKFAVAASSALLSLWLFMCYATSVYWHTPFEKITGFGLGLVGFALTQLPFRSQAQTHRSAVSQTRHE